MIRLIDLFRSQEEAEATDSEGAMTPSEALITLFGILTRGNGYVVGSISECLSDAEEYYSSRQNILENRGLQYSPEAKPWLCVIAAVESAIEKGCLVEISEDCSVGEFSAALKKVLASADTVISPNSLDFDAQKSLAAWTRQFNQYAGQFGMTLYFVDLYGKSRVMGAARIADYAEAAETAGFAGVRITCRPD